MEDAAIEGYRGSRLSHRQVGLMLGLDYWETRGLLELPETIERLRRTIPGLIPN